MSELENTHQILNQLKQSFQSAPEDLCSLEALLETAIKHLPAYYNILRTHVAQLKTVLNTEAHRHQKLENLTLSKPIFQLIELFEEFSEQDIESIAHLADALKTFVPHKVQELSPIN